MRVGRLYGIMQIMWQSSNPEQRIEDDLKTIISLLREIVDKLDGNS